MKTEESRWRWTCLFWKKLTWDVLETWTTWHGLHVCFGRSAFICEQLWLCQVKFLAISLFGVTFQLFSDQTRWCRWHEWCKYNRITTQKNGHDFLPTFIIYFKDVHVKWCQKHQRQAYTCTWWRHMNWWVYGAVEEGKRSFSFSSPVHFSQIQ